MWNQHEFDSCPLGVRNVTFIFLNPIWLSPQPPGCWHVYPVSSFVFSSSQALLSPLFTFTVMIKIGLQKSSHVASFLPSLLAQDCVVHLWIQSSRAANSLGPTLRLVAPLSTQQTESLVALGKQIPQLRWSLSCFTESARPSLPV